MWSWYFIVLLVAIVLPRERMFVKGLMHLCLESLAGFGLSFLLWLIFEHSQKLSQGQRLLRCACFVVMAAAVWTEFKWITFSYIVHNVWLIPSLRSFGEWFLFSFSVMSSCLVFYYSIHYHLLLITEREKHLLARAQTQEAQLKMLRYQLNPHFMLNTMNAISTLILKNENNTAVEMVDRLSDFLSYSLDGNPDDKVELAAEIEHLEQFVGIEKARFSDRLHYECHLKPSAKVALVPSMLLQPLVENSIKYAVSARESGGHIRVSAEQIKDRLKIVVKDDGESSEGKNLEGRGVGLSNTKERLKTLYGDSYELNFSQTQSSGVTLSILIPYETQVKG